MGKVTDKIRNRRLRQARVRSVVSGTPGRPRLRVHISNLHISAQLIDDTSGRTLAQASTIGQKSASGSMSDKAAWVGRAIADAAKAKKIKRVVFDRGGKLYHGRIKTLAETARQSGLEF